MPSGAASIDWPRILRLYDDLLRIKPSPVVALNRAVAVAHVHGARAALEAIEAMAQRQRLESNYLLHAVVGDLHARLNDHAAAIVSFQRALELSQVGPEQAHLQRALDRSLAELEREKLARGA
jgi:RNA polymerase sigma-70 factor (ECF subfamily)